MPLSLVVPDLQLNPMEVPEAQRLTLPPMPALERLLCWADAPRVSRDWRSGVAADVGAVEYATRPVAQVAAWSLASPPADGGVCLAAPVHCVVGISHVRLHPAGLLRLAPDEAAGFCASFNSDLGGGELQLAPLAEGLLLSGPGVGVAGETGAADPALLLGTSLRTGALGRADPLLRRLGAEAQMWLHDHPLNRIRERRGELPVNALWFWGAGAAAPLEPRPVAGATVACGTEPWLAGLWTALQRELRTPVDRFAALESPDALVLARATGSAGSAAPLERLEGDWFAPLLAALEAGRLQEVTLQLGTHRWLIRRRGLSRLWRRPVPWWRQITR